jgi:C4-dicarboxylate-specific signal transduction histidine kinase
MGLAALLAALAIFVVDMMSDLELAIAVLYISVIVLASTFCSTRGVVAVAIGCSLLTLCSFVFADGSPQTGMVNATVSLLTIAVTTYLILRIGSAQVSAVEARAQLAHVARLTALGELSASIAHEVNQPLTAVVTSGNACLRWLSADPVQLDRARSAVERIVKDANRASEVLGRVRRLAAPAPAPKEQVDVNDLIRDVVELTASEIGQHSIHLRTSLSDRLPRVIGDRIQLQQVLLNLIINSIESIELAGGGVRDIVVSSMCNGDGSVRVAVADSGHGLDPGAADKIFEPFHTTKRTGIGIGLTISRSIIEGHGGRIWAAPGSERGAVLAFSLPTRTDQAAS